MTTQHTNAIAATICASILSAGCATTTTPTTQVSSNSAANTVVHCPSPTLPKVIDDSDETFKKSCAFAAQEQFMDIVQAFQEKHPDDYVGSRFNIKEPNTSYLLVRQGAGNNIKANGFIVRETIVGNLEERNKQLSALNDGLSKLGDISYGGVISQETGRPELTLYLREFTQNDTWRSTFIEAYRAAGFVQAADDLNGSPALSAWPDMPRLKNYVLKKYETPAVSVTLQVFDQDKALPTSPNLAYHTKRHLSDVRPKIATSGILEFDGSCAYLKPTDTAKPRQRRLIIFEPGSATIDKNILKTLDSTYKVGSNVNFGGIGIEGFDPKSTKYTIPAGCTEYDGAVNVWS